MTRLQKILLKMSEHRQALNTLLDAENRTDEQQADLEKRTGEIQDGARVARGHRSRTARRRNAHRSDGHRGSRAAGNQEPDGIP